MTKEQFLNELGKALSPLSHTEREKSLAYYSELIDDRMENGMTEEQAVSGLETPSEIAAGILDDATESASPQPKKPVSLALLILGAPLWIPLLIAAASVLFSLYITYWSLIISFVAVGISFALTSVACLLSFAVMLTENTPHAITALGVSLFFGGISVLLYFPIKSAIVFSASFTKRSCLYLIGKLTGKDDCKL